MDSVVSSAHQQTTHHTSVPLESSFSSQTIPDVTVDGVETQPDVTKDQPLHAIDFVADREVNNTQQESMEDTAQAAAGDRLLSENNEDQNLLPMDRSDANNVEAVGADFDLLGFQSPSATIDSSLDALAVSTNAASAVVEDPFTSQQTGDAFVDPFGMDASENSAISTNSIVSSSLQNESFVDPYNVDADLISKDDGSTLSKANDESNAILSHDAVQMVVDERIVGSENIDITSTEHVPKDGADEIDVNTDSVKEESIPKAVDDVEFTNVPGSIALNAESSAEELVEHKDDELENNYSLGGENTVCLVDQSANETIVHHVRNNNIVKEVANGDDNTPADNTSSLGDTTVGDQSDAKGAVDTNTDSEIPRQQVNLNNFNEVKDQEHPIEDETLNLGGSVVDEIPNDISDLGLADALNLIVALTKERDAALAICREKEEQSDINAQSDELLVEVQTRLQMEMNRRAESDSEVRKLRDELKKYDDQLMKFSALEDDYEQAKANLVMIVSEKSKLETEIVKLREFKDESEQKEVLLSSRLNEAKKKEANKGQAAWRLEAENETLKEDLEKAKTELNAMTQAKAKVESNMEKLKAKAVERVKQAETALAEERELNEERKRKMKMFVESKAEELREAKEGLSDMQIELQETRTSLRSSREREESIQKELEGSRIKCRELQRDMEMLKRSQQEMHKLGSTLEHELEKSANETEEHKKKRMSAKHELMTMVRTLEVEKSVSGKLRESIKFTFTPKALSQQQLLSECLKDFEVELERLATKLGKTLSFTPQIGDTVTAGESSVNADFQNVNETSKKNKRNARGAKSDTDIERLISNLEHETQHVSKGIMSLAGSIERMRSLMDEDHTFNCMAYFSNVLTALGHQEARHQRLGNNRDNDDREEVVSITSFDQGSSTF